MPKKDSNRLNRIDEEMKKEISHIITYDLKDPNITGLISVTKVKVSGDLKYAKVYVSMLNAKDNKQVLAALKKSAGFVRTEVAKRINLRTTPEIIFIFDDSIEYCERIDTILKNVIKDIKPVNKGELFMTTLDNIVEEI